MRIVEWNEYDGMIKKLGKKLKFSKEKFKNVYGVPRGGLVVAVGISHILNIPMIMNISDVTKDTLIVDDISDSGGTLKKFNKHRSIVGTLFIDQDTEYIPDFWVELNVGKEWIKFPYETGEEDTVSQVVE